MPPFPKNFEEPKFDKYKGKGNPKDHIRYLYAPCTEVTYDEIFDVYFLMQSHKTSYGLVCIFVEEYKILE